MTADWQSRPFEQCIEPVVYTAKVQRKDFLADGPYPVVSQEEAFVNGFWDQEADIFRVERPLVVFGDHTRALKYIDFDFVLGADGVKVLKPKPFLHPRFFYYQLHTAKLDSLGYARHYRLLKEHHVAYPAYAEQQRIAAILDEAFEGIATAKANAEKNLQNARELFTSHLERVFGQRGADWHEAPLLSFASAISTGPFGSLLHKSDYVSDGVPLVNPINIVDGLIVPDPDKLIDSTTKQRLQSYVLREGDIVVGRRGEIGRCAVVGPNEAGWVCGTGCFFVRPLPTVRSAFIAHLIRSREYRARLEHASTGATMKNLSNTALGELHVAVPPIAEQDRALALIGRLAEDCGRLEDVYERKLAALDELKKSLLHQAFTGALTAKSIDKQVAEVA